MFYHLIHKLDCNQLYKLRDNLQENKKLSSRDHHVYKSERFINLFLPLLLAAMQIKFLLRFSHTFSENQDRLAVIFVLDVPAHASSLPSLRTPNTLFIDPGQNVIIAVKSKFNTRLTTKQSGNQEKNNLCLQTPTGERVRGSSNAGRFDKVVLSFCQNVHKSQHWICSLLLNSIFLSYTTLSQRKSTKLKQEFHQKILINNKANLFNWRYNQQYFRIQTEH